MSSKVNYEAFITKHTKPSVNLYITYDLVESDKDSPTAVARLHTSPEGRVTYYLKRTLTDRFFNHLEYDAHTRNDIRFQTASQSPQWVRISQAGYDKYLEFLNTGSRVALAKAERAFLEQ